MRLAMIAALSANGVIGVGNELPWHLPDDLRYFKQHTLGKPIIMGRKTFESIGKALPGRTNIVLTSRKNWSPQGVAIVASLDAALALANSEIEARGGDEAMVIGGEQVYRLALPRCSRLYLTRVAVVIAGDAFFPDLNPGEWREIASVAGRPLPNAPTFTFVTLDRCGSQPETAPIK